MSKYVVKFNFDALNGLMPMKGSYVPTEDVSYDKIQKVVAVMNIYHGPDSHWIEDNISKLEPGYYTE